MEDVFTTVAPEADIVPELSSEAVAFTCDDLQTLTSYQCETEPACLVPADLGALVTLVEIVLDVT